MKALAVVLMCVISSIQCYSQDACSSLDKESEKIQKLKSKLKENYRKNLYDDLLKSSGNAANYYEQCIALNRNLSPAELLPAYYQIGKYYYDAGSCERSNAYFRKCLTLSTVSSQKFNSTTRTYKEIIADRLKEKQCYNTGAENNAGLKLVTSKFSYRDGKNLYVQKISEQTNELPEGKNNSNVPYFADEIDLLQSRVYNLRDSVRAMDSLKKIGGSTADYRKTGPFLLVNVKSPVSNDQSGGQSDQDNQAAKTHNIAVQSITKDI
ncbi:MAG: hypothetical protein ABWY16_10400, partial [Pedobacter sp.]|uniref:hypothetical protein n=1 Tax=Pedobacter sp. TaxID=1411316 RepID=UPI003396BAD4